MTFQEFESQFENGFHDAQLKSISIDYMSKLIEMMLDLWTGVLEDPSRKEEYLPVHIKISGLEYCLIGAPTADYPYDDEGSVCIDAFYDRSSDAPEPGVGCFYVGFFVTDWNSDIEISAKSVELVSQGTPYIRGRE